MFVNLSNPGIITSQDINPTNQSNSSNSVLIKNSSEKTISSPSVNFNGIDIPGGVVDHIFSYVGEDLNDCRLACKTFQVLIDTNRNKLYPPHLIHLYEKYLGYKVKVRLDQPREEKAQSLQKQIQTLQTNKQIASLSLSSRLKSSWLSYFVSNINQNGLLGKILNLAMIIFTGIKQEIREQGQLQATIKDCDEKLIELNNQLTSLVTHKLSNSSLIAKSNAQEAYFKARNLYLEQKRYISQSREIAAEIFGGKNVFESLPILEVLKGLTYLSEEDYIKVEDPYSIMTAPIMRGQDNSGREFVLIRAKEKNRLYEVCQVFFQRHPNQSLWVHSGTNITKINNILLINKGQIQIDSESRQNIKAFVTNGSNDRYILE